jgi:hypothetical protein
VSDLVASKDLIHIGDLVGISEEVWLCKAERKIPNPAIESLE